MPIILVPKSKKKTKLETKPEKLEIESKKLEIKPKNKSLIRRKKGKQVLPDLKDRDPNQPETPQEKRDIQKLKDNLKRDKQKPLTPKQKKLDVDKDGQLEASDFEMLRKKKSVVSAMTGGQIVAMMYDD